MESLMKITDYTVNGECSNCGKCCSNCLPMSKDEVKRIKRYIKKHRIKEQRHNIAAGVDMTCPFRDEANQKCLIYEIRPAICRSFQCNHKIADIQKEKDAFHKSNRVVFMRDEFFGNKEDVNYFYNLLKGM